MYNFIIICFSELIESVWAAGFDEVGAAQLQSSLVGSRKWIGTSEVAVALAHLRVPYIIF